MGQELVDWKVVCQIIYQPLKTKVGWQLGQGSGEREPAIHKGQMPMLTGKHLQFVMQASPFIHGLPHVGSGSEIE